jgi:hypothetical protein
MRINESVSRIAQISYIFGVLRGRHLIGLKPAFEWSSALSYEEALQQRHVERGEQPQWSITWFSASRIELLGTVSGRML